MLPFSKPKKSPRSKSLATLSVRMYCIRKRPLKR
nr:MAG TPA: hypothetical protein [Caudoviricetes sp.]